MEYLGITNSGRGIGDKVQFAGLPENYFKSTGNKMVDLDNSWVFDYNPYVERGVKPTLGQQDLWFKNYPRGFYLSQQERWCKGFGLQVHLRHPRLYRFEDAEINHKRVVVHATGKTFGSMPNKVIEQIQKNYDGYEIVQIGLSSDAKTPFKNCLNWGAWETIEIIASSGIFIGVNSGFMNIAKCYSRIRKKVLVQNKDLNLFHPCLDDTDGWIDFNWEYFNDDIRDIGITNSFLKI